MKKALFLLSIPLVLLGVFAVMQWRMHQHFSSEDTVAPDLSELLPEEIPGWKIWDQPIASTPEIQAAVGEMLNFDDGIFRIYQRGGVELGVYVAYWTPGKMSYRLVAGHTPDVCWVNAGWQSRPEAINFSYQYEPVEGLVFQNGQHRIFEQQGIVKYTLFWHLLNGESIGYGRAGLPPVTAIFTDIFSKGINQREEQYFIRLSSSVPIEELKKEPQLEPLFRALGNFGLKKDNTGTEG